MSKPKIAFFDFTSCEGCQIELTNMGDEVFMGLLDHVEFVEFREVMTEKHDGRIDISFIEGAFSRRVDRARLEDIRARSDMVVAYGACASTGGVPALKNHQDDYAEFVYGRDAYKGHLSSQDAKPISAAIKVDYEIHGCPIDKDEFVYIVSHLLHGKMPVIPDQPVCVECKRRETVCRYQQGDHCMGLVALGGCNAICPSEGIPCEACRGFVTNVDESLLEQVLVVQGGLTESRAKTKSRMFTANLRSDSQ